MTLVIVAKSKDGRDDLADRMTRAGLNVTVPQALTKLMIVEGATLDGFAFRDDPQIMSIEEDRPDAFSVAVQSVAIDTLPTSGSWGLLRHTNRDLPWNKSVKLPLSQDFSCARDATGVDYYCIDSGIRTSHQEFGGRATAIDGFTPVYFHGTCVTSLGAGAMSGFARGAEIFVAAGLRGAGGTGTTTDIVNAFNAVLTHYNGRAGMNRPAVLSMSFGGGSSSAYSSGVADAIDAGMVCIAAAGNDAKHLDGEVDFYPTELKGVVCVGGTSMDDGPYHIRGYGTNYGLSVDILGASQHVRAADFTGDTDYKTVSGTSLGTPYVAGIAACELQGYNRLTSRAEVSAMGRFLYNNATFGRYRPHPSFEPMTPAIAYLDPGAGPFPTIPGLTKSA